MDTTPPSGTPVIVELTAVVQDPAAVRAAADAAGIGPGPDGEPPNLAQLVGSTITQALETAGFLVTNMSVDSTGDHGDGRATIQFHSSHTVGWTEAAPEPPTPPDEPDDDPHG
jgi:hypothetical protein